MKATTIEELRDKFFEECVSENTGGYKVINYAPHDLFEWIKENIKQNQSLQNKEKNMKETIISLREEYLAKKNLSEIKNADDYAIWLEKKILEPAESEQATEEMIKIIKDAWYNGLGSHHNAKTQKEYDIDFECFFDTIKDYIKIFKNES